MSNNPDSENAVDAVVTTGGSPDDLLAELVAQVRALIAEETKRTAEAAYALGEAVRDACESPERYGSSSGAQLRKRLANQLDVSEAKLFDAHRVVKALPRSEFDGWLEKGLTYSALVEATKLSDAAARDLVLSEAARKKLSARDIRAAVQARKGSSGARRKRGDEAGRVAEPLVGGPTRDVGSAAALGQAAERATEALAQLRDAYLRMDAGVRLPEDVGRVLAVFSRAFDETAAVLKGGTGVLSGNEGGRDARDRSGHSPDVEGGEDGGDLEHGAARDSSLPAAGLVVETSKRPTLPAAQLRAAAADVPVTPGLHEALLQSVRQSSGSKLAQAEGDGRSEVESAVSDRRSIQ